jgi:hypothetical protein
VLDDGKLVHEELSTQTDIRKLRRSLRRALGKSLIMEGLGT